MKLWPFRRDNTVLFKAEDDPVAYNRNITAGFREKADHNKRESQTTFFLVIVASLMAPLFVTLGTTTLDGKVVPATLSLVAAAATSWLQLRKPQRLWSLYRRAQRHLENELVKYQYRLGEYASAANPASLLAENTANIALEAHRLWEGLIPDPDSLGTVVAGQSRVRGDKETDHAGTAD